MVYIQSNPDRDAKLSLVYHNHLKKKKNLMKCHIIFWISSQLLEHLYRELSLVGQQIVYNEDWQISQHLNYRLHLD